ncbi:lipopolysaccharide biosynthesis protein [Thiosocius teredinicola]|uniref:lipopolysaccharide biosynthesis protein n=1 Tax=Thiosocius teredinicola TaxID=1973002 RepID=UPI000990B98A
MTASDERLKTDTLSKGAKGGAVALVGQGAQLVIQFVGTVVLARLLSPDDFGIFAMLTVFLGIGQLIRDFGMPTAALQARSLSEQQASNVFWVTAALSTAVAVLLVLATPLIVALYDQPELSLIAPAMAGVLVVNGLQAQYKVRLARQMRFSTVTLIAVLAQLAGLGAGILSALLGAGYWALVIQATTMATATLVLSVAASRWLPMRPRRGHGSLPLLHTGVANGAASLLGYAADNADNLMIGMMWGAGALGQYNRAFQLFMSAVMSFFNPLTSVVVPTVNRAIAEGRSSQDILARSQTALCGPAIWLLMVTAATADYLIPLLLGDQWGQTIPLLQILAVGGAFKALSQTNYWAYLIEQQSKQLLLSNLVTKPMQIALIVVAAFHSVEAVAWAFSLGRAITWPINVIWLWKTAGQDPVRFAANGIRLVGSALIGFAVTAWLYYAVQFESPWLAVLAGATLSTLTFLVVAVLLPGGRREAVGAIGLVRMILSRKRG